jgi:hypothetical protein
MLSESAREGERAAGVDQLFFTTEDTEEKEARISPGWPRKGTRVANEEQLFVPFCGPLHDKISVLLCVLCGEEKRRQ